MKLEFFLPMNPPTVTHQEKQVRVVNGKPRFYEPQALKSARAMMYDRLCCRKPAEPLSGGVRLVVKWCFPRGRHRDGAYRVTKPDTDNLQKLLKDCMTQAGFWQDDAQVCSEIVEKFWAERPGIYVKVEPL
ncbi:RusA family crossover junction endodeoxyribonuclease [Butyricicoccus sp. 1XD8-22]|nr:RusA family crossover junction endodeoxyribonuclease [Butyricicoccus sp. 1XD8-22]